MEKMRQRAGSEAFTPTCSQECAEGTHRLLSWRPRALGSLAERRALPFFRCGAATQDSVATVTTGSDLSQVWAAAKQLPRKCGGTHIVVSLSGEFHGRTCLPTTPPTEAIEP